MLAGRFSCPLRRDHFCLRLTLVCALYNSLRALRGDYGMAKRLRQKDTIMPIEYRRNYRDFAGFHTAKVSPRIALKIP